MGAWGSGTFENDDASDWVYELEQASSWDLVHRTLAVAAEPTGYLEAPDCSAALAAAEVVAAAVSRPAPDLPEEISTWVGTHRAQVPHDLAALSVRAIDRITVDSELRELWDETGEADAWSAAVRALRERLAG